MAAITARANVIMLYQFLLSAQIAKELTNRQHL